MRSRTRRDLATARGTCGHRPVEDDPAVEQDATTRSATCSRSSTFWVTSTTAPPSSADARAPSPRAAAAGAGRARRSARRAAARRVGEQRDRQVEPLPVADGQGRRRPPVVGKLEAARAICVRVAGTARAARRARGSAAATAARSAPGRCGIQPDAHARRRARPCPRSASSAPARIASSVDLPAPFGPTRARTSPGLHLERRSRSSATWSPKRRETPRAASSGAPCHAAARATRRGGGSVASGLRQRARPGRGRAARPRPRPAPVRPPCHGSSATRSEKNS